MFEVIADRIVSWWSGQTDQFQLLLLATIILYSMGVASKFRQYELFCRQTFAPLYVTVLGELAPKHKLNPRALQRLMSPIDDFVAKFSVVGIMLALLWPVITPLSAIYVFVAPNGIPNYEIALWMSDLTAFELLLASVLRFSVMSHSKALIATIAALSAVCPAIGDQLRKNFVEGDDNEDSNE